MCESVSGTDSFKWCVSVCVVSLGILILHAPAGVTTGDVGVSRRSALRGLRWFWRCAFVRQPAAEQLAATRPQLTPSPRREGRPDGQRPRPAVRYGSRNGSGCATDDCGAGHQCSSRVGSHISGSTLVLQSERRCRTAHVGAFAGCGAAAVGSSRPSNRSRLRKCTAVVIEKGRRWRWAVGQRDVGAWAPQYDCGSFL
jgi:hypothetical protein